MEIALGNSGATLMQAPSTTRYAELESLLRRKSRLDLNEAVLISAQGDLLGITTQPDDVLKVQKSFLLVKKFVDPQGEVLKADAVPELESIEEIAKILGISESDKAVLQALNEFRVFTSFPLTQHRTFHTKAVLQ